MWLTRYIVCVLVKKWFRHISDFTEMEEDTEEADCATCTALTVEGLPVINKETGKQMIKRKRRDPQSPSTSNICFNPAHSLIHYLSTHSLKWTYNCLYNTLRKKQAKSPKPSSSICLNDEMFFLSSDEVKFSLRGATGGFFMLQRPFIDCSIHLSNIPTDKESNLWPDDNPDSKEVVTLWKT